MTDLHCDVTHCANNKDQYCCRPDINVDGPNAVASNQTFCANFLDQSSSPSDAVDSSSPNPSLDIHCDAVQCGYNRRHSCIAEHIDIRTVDVNNGQVKTECSTFQRK